MFMASRLVAQLKLVWRFLGFFQSPSMRIIHALVAVLVILQILSSYGMDFLSSSVMWSAFRPLLFNWYHILAGLFLVLLSLILTAKALAHHGLRFFFPYLWGDVEQLRKDLLASLRFKMVPPRPKGLGAVVQGLGLGALLLATLSGLLWFALWTSGQGTVLALSVHKNIVILIELYLIGHGFMALFHFFLWRKRVPSKP